ncbi:MAG: type II secretion system protein GspM [Gammaproteobacteria bacterium]
MKLARWQHGLLSFLILITLVALIFAACVRPALTYYKDKQTELQTQQERLHRYKNVAAQKDTLLPFYKKQINQSTDTINFMQKMAPSLAAAKLQQQIKSLLEKNQGQLISTQPIPAQPEDMVTPIMIKVHIKSNTKALLHILHNLESSQPLVFIQNLQIQSVGRNKKKANNRSQNKVIKPLNTRFDLKVYMLNEGTSPAL